MTSPQPLSDDPKPVSRLGLLCRGVSHVLMIAALSLSLSAHASAALNPSALLPAARIDTLKCTTTLDRSRGGKLAAGLILKCTVQADSVASYEIIGQLYQDSLRGPLAYADAQCSNKALAPPRGGRTIRVLETGPGPLQLTLWFPASGIRRNARRGAAWAEIEVSLAGAQPHKHSSGVASPAPRWYWCRLPKLDPAEFTNTPLGRVPPSTLPTLVSK